MSTKLGISRFSKKWKFEFLAGFWALHFPFEFFFWKIGLEVQKKNFRRHQQICKKKIKILKQKNNN